MHGRDFKPSAETLHEICIEALDSGLQRDCPVQADAFAALNTELAYYADLSAEVLSAEGKHYDEVLDVGDRRNALAALQAIKLRKKFGIRRYDKLPGKSALAEFIANIAAPVLGALGLWGWLCCRCAPDFAHYFDEQSAYGEAVRERVRSRLVAMLEAGDRVMLLSHGTGSVVAWDVLWELSHKEPYASELKERKVDVWVTLGSPLSDAQVQKRIFGAREKSLARWPGNVISWCNVAAEDDYTCHDNTLADDFRHMLNERRLSAVTDYKIYNHAVRYGKSNPHSSVGYYIHPRVTKILADWLQT